jgi:hypothetical protein
MGRHSLALGVLLLLGATTVAQSQSTARPTAPHFLLTVTDENGVAVSSARVFLQMQNLPFLRCETDFAGTCSLSGLPPGTYRLRVEKEGFYALDLPSLAVTAGAKLEVSLFHVQEVREVINVVESPPAIDPAQVSSQEKLSGLDVINIPYPAAHDYRNVLNFIPGVVQAGFGGIHIAGAQTYQTLTLLDGFNITQPANGQILARVSTDAFRSIEVEPSRESAEYGKGSAGVLSLNTGIGDDHFRFAATNFLPSLQNKNGWRVHDVLPHLTFSGPIHKGKVWFFNAFDGEYDNFIFTELPRHADNDHVVRISNLFKLQANLSNRNILTPSFLLNHLHDNYAFLSPQSPQQANPADTETAYIGSLKDQHYFAGGQLLETGFGYDQYNLKLTPYGTLPYFTNTVTAGGNYYLAEQTKARRWQLLSNLYLPPRHWYGRHDFKLGADLDRIAYDAQFNRQSISFLTGTLALPVGATCLSLPQTPTFPCTRFSAFTAAPLHRQFDTEVSTYIQDRWLITDRLLLEPGLRFDWDQIVRDPLFSPRLAGTYVLDNSGNTKFSAGIGIVYDATPIFLIARPFTGTRQDTFYAITPACVTNRLCSPAVDVTGPVTTSFIADTRDLRASRFLNWSIGLEKKLPAAIYMKAEFLQKRGAHEFVYDTLNGASSGTFVLQNTRQDRYDAFQITLRRNFRESYTLVGAYTHSRARSNQALDFNVDSPILSSQQPGPYPWDTPDRFLSWGYMPFFKLPLIKRTEIAYSMEARTGFPFNVTNNQQQLVGEPASHRFPEYFSLNVQLEKRFHMLGYYWAVRGGVNNITGHRNPFIVNSNIDSPQFLTFSAFQGRYFTSRIRLLGRK